MNKCYILLFFIFLNSIFSQTRFDTFIRVGMDDSLDATCFIPTTLPPTNGYPVMLFVHGFEFSK